MSLARDCPEGFIQQAGQRAGRTSKSPSRFAARSSKIQQNTARPGKTGRAYARHPGSLNSKEQTGNRALVIGCGVGGPVAAMALQRAGIEA